MKEVARVFSRKKIIEIPLLNKMGVQVFRVLLAQFLFNFRSKFRYNPKFKNDVESFNENGALIKKDFLDSEVYAKAKQEAIKAIEEEKHLAKEKCFGTNRKILINIHELPKEKYPTLHELVTREYFSHLFSAATRRNIDFKVIENGTIAQIEFLIQGDDSLEDVETQIHSDIFYNSYKAWLYMTNITKSHGPLTYFMKSRNNDKVKLRYEYRNSVRKNPDKSRRILQEELNERNLKETVLDVNENTFVMADINGYHRRLKGEKGKERLAIIFRERGTPFIK